MIGAAFFKLTVTDRLPAFCARNEAPIKAALRSGSAPSRRAKSPPPGASTLMTSAPQERQLIGGERPREHIGEVEDAGA